MEGGGNSTEQPPGGDGLPASVHGLASTYSADVDGFAVDTLRGGWAEGTVVYDEQSHNYLYADSQFTKSGVLSATAVYSSQGDLRTVYWDSKRKRVPCSGWWALACEFIDEVIPPPPPEDPVVEDPNVNDVIDDTAVLCLASKQIVVASIDQAAASCAASGGIPDIDYGDMCGAGATFKCDMPNSPEEPPEH